MKKLVLVVIDGLTPEVLERAVESGRAPSLAFLAEHGSYGPDVHRIPHLVWYHRDERRLVEYGSSFGALRAAGMARSIFDTIYGMNASHLGRDAVTVFEALADAGHVD